MSKVLIKFMALAIFMLSNLVNAEIKPLPLRAAPLNSEHKIDVIEFFWYGCGHCNEIEPHVNKWQQTLADDVNFVKIPAFTGDTWNIHGQIYLTLEAMNAPHDIHSKVFDAIHHQQKYLIDKSELSQFLTNNNIDVPQFFKVHDSAGVKMQIEKYSKLIRSYRIRSVPSFVVGNHMITIDGTKGPTHFLDEVDGLITQERKLFAPNSPPTNAK